ncbi:MAG: alpha/beta fold hydrolase [Acidobacteriota bacterium]|nr:alpha/beta fold hydrolase [Acidobacteriota bacterium]
MAPSTIDEEISLELEDGLITHGLLVLPEHASRPLPLVLLLHAFGKDRDGMLDLADALASRGMAALAIDIRGHGASSGTTGRELFSYAVIPQKKLRQAVDDQRQVINHLRGHPRLDLQRLGVVGIAEGGQIAAALGGRLPEVRGLVIVDAVAPAPGFHPDTDLGYYGERPALFICSAVPRSKIQAEVLANYGTGERKIFCTDTYESGDDLVMPPSPAVEEVVHWLEDKLAAVHP